MERISGWRRRIDAFLDAPLDRKFTAGASVVMSTAVTAILTWNEATGFTTRLIVFVACAGFLFVRTEASLQLHRFRHRRRRERRVDHADARSRTTLRAAALLLPAEQRARYVPEWLDHVETARENGEEVRRVVRSIVLRSLFPLVLRAWTRRFGAVVARR